YVHLLPNIAGFVGADHVADLLATGIWETKETVLLVDIGTNTEISLIRNGRITAASCASGPAFEGGHIKHGMRAASGAIEKIRISGDTVCCQTIDNAPPAGICGSGILDAMAQLYISGVIDKGGKINGNHPRIRQNEGQKEFVLVDRQGERSEIVVTQHDIRELQMAKAAIRAGIEALMNVNHCVAQDLQQVIIAGAFGNYIDVASAIAVGMLPALPLDRFRQVGNAAGTGARLALISSSQRTLAQKIARKVKYLELARTPDFMEILIGASLLGEYQPIKIV
ncbi:MAG: ASKHA domain-containing protein, partial [Dehalococcoidales bacterium]|nr:ASKHA domain-containing protein [Dehalococcoidales bacterium]